MHSSRFCNEHNTYAISALLSSSIILAFSCFTTLKAEELNKKGTTGSAMKKNSFPLPRYLHLWNGTTTINGAITIDYETIWEYHATVVSVYYYQTGDNFSSCDGPISDDGSSRLW